MKKTEVLQNLLTVVLVVCAVVVTGLLVRRELFPPNAQGRVAPAGGTVVSEWRSYSDSKNRRGPREAAVTIVEFSDFQCPFCRIMAARLDSINAEYPEEVAVVYRHFPLSPIHPHAVAAAQASECAAAQGRFWQMHDALFALQDSIGRMSWSRYADRAGVPDTTALHRCMSRPATAGVLHSDTIAGRRLRVDATPTLLINQYRFDGAIPLDSLRVYVRRAASR